MEKSLKILNEKYLKEVESGSRRSRFSTALVILDSQSLSKGVDENVIKTLVGHEKEFTMKHYGGNPYDAEQLLKEISKVEYQCGLWSLRVDWKRESDLERYC